jgi:hypothetical protein
VACMGGQDSDHVAIMIGDTCENDDLTDAHTHTITVFSPHCIYVAIWMNATRQSLLHFSGQ